LARNSLPAPIFARFSVVAKLFGRKWFPWGDPPDPMKANYRAQGESFFAGPIRPACERWEPNPLGATNEMDLAFTTAAAM